MKSFLTISLFYLGLLSALPLAAQQAPPAKPNIIYILMDDLGIEEIQPYNPKALPTPNLNRLAQEGMRFTQHYAGTSVCAPSRCVLMTGKHTGRAEVRGNIQMEPSGQMPLSDKTVTVAEMLQQAGYRSVLLGKWGLGVEGTSGEPTRQGFASYYGYLDQVLAHNAFPAYLLRNGKREMLNNTVQWEDTSSMFKGLGSYATEKRAYSNELFTREAVKFLQQPQDKPFFLYLAYTIPHNNGEAPWEDRFEAPSFSPYEQEAWSKTDKSYAATLRRMDEYVGKIMTTLEQTGLSGNTVVFFSSDNGAAEDAPDRFTAHFQWRGRKRSPYEGGLRVPLIAWWPGKIAAGSRSDHFTGMWDFMATACEAAGVKPPTGTDGQSIWPVLTGQRKNVTPMPAYFEFHEQGGWQAYIKGQQKLIYFHKDNRYELYDLKRDAGEKRNLADEKPEVVKGLIQEMQMARTPSAHFNFGKK